MSGSPPELEPLADVLRRNGLAGVPEEPFPNDGWSGASLSLLRRAGGDRFVLKRDSLARDWIARSTNDGPILREAWFAAHGPTLPSPIRAPYLGAGVDGDEFGILMPDLTGVLFDWDAPISVEDLDRILSGLASLHAYPWTTSAELDRDRCDRDHLPVDEIDRAAWLDPDIGELEIAVDERRRHRRQRIDERPRILPERVDQLTDFRRHTPVECVPTREDPLADGVACRSGSLEGCSTDQGKPLRDGTPRPGLEHAL